MSDVYRGEMHQFLNVSGERHGVQVVSRAEMRRLLMINLRNGVLKFRPRCARGTTFPRGTTLGMTRLPFFLFCVEMHQFLNVSGERLGVQSVSRAQQYTGFSFNL